MKKFVAIALIGFFYTISTANVALFASNALKEIAQKNGIEVSFSDVQVDPSGTCRIGAVRAKKGSDAQFNLSGVEVSIRGMELIIDVNSGNAQLQKTALGDQSVRIGKSKLLLNLKSGKLLMTVASQLGLIFINDGQASFDGVKGTLIFKPITGKTLKYPFEA